MTALFIYLKLYDFATVFYSYSSIFFFGPSNISCNCLISVRYKLKPWSGKQQLWNKDHFNICIYSEGSFRFFPSIMCLLAHGCLLCNHFFSSLIIPHLHFSLPAISKGPRTLPRLWIDPKPPGIGLMTGHRGPAQPSHLERRLYPLRFLYQSITHAKWHRMSFHSYSRRMVFNVFICHMLSEYINT